LSVRSFAHDASAKRMIHAVDSGECLRSLLHIMNEVAKKDHGVLLSYILC